MSVTELETTNAQTIPGFDEAAFGGLDTGSEHAVLRAKREAAFAAYQSLPAPTMFTEEWRKTHPSLFPFADLTVLPQAEDGTVDAGTWDDQFDVVVAVKDQQVSIADVSGLLAQDAIKVMTLADAAVQCPELVNSHMQGSALPADTDKFTALNASFWNFGLFVHIPAGFQLEKGILLRVEQTRDRAVFVPRVVVVAGDRSQATLVEHYTSPDAATMASINAKEVYVGDAARFRYLTLQEWGRNSYQVENNMAVVQRDAQIDWITLNLGSKVSKLQLGSDVAGEGSSAELDGVFFTHEDQHIDQTTLQIHSAPNTYSRLLYKGAVKDQGHSVYRGIIQAKPGAIKVDAYQTNNNLVLSNGAVADTIPGLLIDADDLKCSHGATIGNLNEEQVFYLRARGIPDHEARKMLILGFYDEILDRIPYEFIRDRVHAVLVERLDAAEVAVSA